MCRTIKCLKIFMAAGLIACFCTTGSIFALKADPLSALLFWSLATPGILFLVWRIFH